MYLLLLCSLSVAAIAIDRFLFYRRAQAGSKELLERMAAVRGNEFLALSSEANDSVTAFLLKAGVKAAQGNGDVILAVESAYSEAAMELRARLNYLSMIVTMAPLLGLLGTIFGMIESFNVFSLSAEEPLAITGGIGEALTATAFGLCVAIFALVVHTVFAQRLDHILAMMDRASAVTLSALRVGNGDDRHAA
ncbi:MAG: MotA/TolQ/ExbB proton channel family protein [Negativicutes bacterium]